MSILREHIVKRFTRSSKWGSVRKKFLKVNNYCAVCNTRKKLEVHHRIPFHVNPELELDTTNLITLCRKHHFSIGHLEYWRSWNIDINTSVIYFNKLLRDRPTKRK